jgi:putative acetyltransferase
LYQPPEIEKLLQQRSVFVEISVAAAPLPRGCWGELYINDFHLSNETNSSWKRIKTLFCDGKIPKSFCRKRTCIGCFHNFPATAGNRLSAVDRKATRCYAYCVKQDKKTAAQHGLRGKNNCRFSEEPGMEKVFFEITTAADPRFARLCTELDAALEEQVHGQFQRTVYAPHNQMDPEATAVLLKDENGEAFGCGALRPLSESTVELKRVFVRSTARRHGCGRKIVESLMEYAKSKGFTEMVLETGRPLVSAIQLYTKMGFSVIQNYGPYRDMPNSVCMYKAL